MQVVLAQKIAECEEVEHPKKRRQLVPRDPTIQLSERTIKQPPAEGLAASRPIWVSTFLPQNQKADQPGQGKKEEAFLPAAFF
jgi:hypothetical protein